MAEAIKVLGQVNPSADTDTTLYTVPADTETVISSVTVANTGAGDLSYRIAVRPNGEAIATKHYLAYGCLLPVGVAETATLGITLDATDVVTVRADSGDAAFNLFGLERT